MKNTGAVDIEILKVLYMLLGAIFVGALVYVAIVVLHSKDDISEALNLTTQLIQKRHDT